MNYLKQIGNFEYGEEVIYNKKKCIIVGRKISPLTNVFLYTLKNIKTNKIFNKIPIEFIDRVKRRKFRNE